MTRSDAEKTLYFLVRTVFRSVAVEKIATGMLQEHLKVGRSVSYGLKIASTYFVRTRHALGDVLEFLFTILGWFSTLVVVALLFLLLTYCATV